MRKRMGGPARWALWAGLVATMIGIVLGLWNVVEKADEFDRKRTGRQIGDTLSQYERTPRR